MLKSATPTPTTPLLPSQVLVRNQTNKSLTLQSKDGDTILILPSATQIIDKKFVSWKTPSPRDLYIYKSNSQNTASAPAPAQNQMAAAPDPVEAEKTIPPQLLDPTTIGKQSADTAQSSDNSNASN